MEKIQRDGTELIYYLLLRTSEEVCKQAYKQNLQKGLANANESGEHNQQNAHLNALQSSTTVNGVSIASSSNGAGAADEKEEGDGVGGGGGGLSIKNSLLTEKLGSAGVESSSQAREEVPRTTKTTTTTTDERVEIGDGDDIASRMEQEPLTSLSSASAPSPASKGVLSVSEKEKDVRPAHDVLDDSGRPSPSAPSSTAAAAPIQVGGDVAAASGASSPSAASPSAGKKRSKKGRFAKKNAAARKKQEKDSSEDANAAAEVSQTGGDSGTIIQTNPQQQQEAEQNNQDAHEPGPEPDNERQSRSITDTAHDRRAESHEATGPSSLSVDDVPPVYRHDHIVRDRKPKTEELTGGANDAVVQKDGGSAPAESSFRPSRSFGRWADVVAEETEDRPKKVMNGMESPVGDVADPERSRNRKERNAEQGLEGSPKTSFKAGGGGGRSVSEKEQGFVEGSQNENTRAQSTKGVEKEQQGAELGGGKTRQVGLDGSKAPDERDENWNNRKEQDLRGKSQQQQQQQLGTSQASRELNWRRRGWNSGGEQHSPRSPSKPGGGGFDGDNKKDEQPDFRSRAAYGTEPQATHKNWVNRRGTQRQGEVEGRAEQNKARGKGKQGREPSGPQSTTSTTTTNNTQHVKDVARQKFEADLRIKKEELLLRSKQSLKAEFQKAKRIEQVKKGSDDLEAELNKNLVYEGGELFFQNF